MRNQLVIFDLDGTLIDSRADLTAAVNDMRRHYGLAPLPLDTVTRYVGNGIRKLVERALEGGPADFAEAVGRTREAYGRRLVEQTRPYPGVPEALAAIHRLGYHQAVVTNKPQEFTVQILRHFGLDTHLGAVIGGDACPQLKPHPAPLFLALEQTGCAAPGSWMVGDNYTDLAAGAAAGLERCFCAYGFGQRGGETSELSVSHIAEFVSCLSRRCEATTT